MSNHNTEEARLWAAISKGMESEGIRPVKIMLMYDVMTHSTLVRVDHIPSKITVAHSVWQEDMPLPLDKLMTKAVDPIVTKMLEALTS